MTTWGAWVYGGGNGARIGWDAAFTPGTAQLNVWITIQTQYTYSGDVCTLTWSGTWAGSQGATINTGAGGTQGIYANVIGTQAYNSTSTTHFVVTGLYNSVTPSVDMSVNLGPLAPAAPTGISSARVSDAQANVAWTDNPTSTAPYDSIAVYRRTGGNSSTDTVVASLAGTATSYSDTGLVADGKYQHAALATNSAGSASSAMSSAIYTTPAAPSSVTATLTGRDIAISITPASSYAPECQYVITHGTITGGVTTWDGSPLTTTGVGVTTYTHTGVSASTHVYKVAAKAPSALTGATTTSNSVPVASTPNAPTGLTISSTRQSGSVIDATIAPTLGWVHNPTDSSGQTAWEVQHQYSTDGGSTWSGFTTTGKVPSTTQNTVAAGAPWTTWVNGRMIRWQVRTWGVYASPSPWSSLFTLTTTAIPVAVVTSGPTCTTSRLLASGSYYDAGGYAQAGSRWSLRTTGGVTLETWTMTDPTQFLAVLFWATVANGTSYVVAYQVQDSLGLWSLEATATIAVSYAPPSTPTVAVSFDASTGSVVGMITNPAPGGGEVAAVANAVYRDGVLLSALSNVPANGAFTDPVPPLGATVSYTVQAISATPSSKMSAAVNVSTAMGADDRVWLNSGPAMTVAASIVYNPVVDLSEGREKVTRAYRKRPYPVQYAGVAMSRVGTVSGSAARAELSAIADLAALPDVGCVRTPEGDKWFVSFGDVKYKIGADTTRLKGFSIPIEQVDYAE